MPFPHYKPNPHRTLVPCPRKCRVLDPTFFFTTLEKEYACRYSFYYWTFSNRMCWLQLEPNAFWLLLLNSQQPRVLITTCVSDSWKRLLWGIAALNVLKSKFIANTIKVPHQDFQSPLTFVFSGRHPANLTLSDSHTELNRTASGAN